MTQGVLCTREDVSDFECACELLVAAIRRIGSHDPLAQEMVGNALQLLRGAPEPIAVLFSAAPPTSARH